MTFFYNLFTGRVSQNSHLVEQAVFRRQEPVTHLQEKKKASCCFSRKHGKLDLGSKNIVIFLALKMGSSSIALSAADFSLFGQCVI